MCNDAMRAAGFECGDMNGLVDVVPAGFAEPACRLSKGHQYTDPLPCSVRDSRCPDAPQLGNRCLRPRAPEKSRECPSPALRSGKESCGPLPTASITPRSLHGPGSGPVVTPLENPPVQNL